MKTIYITRRETFNAAHKLWREDWSEEKNWEVFGKCSNKNWHGHNFSIFVTVKGFPSADTGFVINLKELSQILKDEVIEPLDHKNLNLDVLFMQGLIPSTENFAKAIWNQLEAHIEGCQLHCIRLQETENMYVDYFGENTIKN